jgi:hypothetical protein
VVKNAFRPAAAGKVCRKSLQESLQECVDRKRRSQGIVTEPYSAQPPHHKRSPPPWNGAPFFCPPGKNLKLTLYNRPNTSLLQPH